MSFDAKRFISVVLPSRTIRYPSLCTSWFCSGMGSQPNSQKDPCAGYFSDPPGVMGVETTKLEFPIGQRFSSRLSLFRLDRYTVHFFRFRCSSGAECSPHLRNSGLLGQLNPYIWGWVDIIALYIWGRRNFSKLRISRSNFFLSSFHVPLSYLYS